MAEQARTVDAEVIPPGNGRPLPTKSAATPKLMTPVKFDLVSMIQSPLFWMIVGGVVVFFGMEHVKKKTP